jgi:Cu/Ag efflux pump CusA
MSASDEDFKDQERLLNEYVKKVDTLTFITVGTDGGNGLRSVSKDLKRRIDEEIEPKVDKMWVNYEKWEEYQKNIKKLFYMVLATLLVSLAVNFFKAKTSEQNRATLEQIESSLNNAIESHAGPK